MSNWSDEFEGAITICNSEGKITYMNERSQKEFSKYGGGELIGTNLLDCHPEPSRSKLSGLLESEGSNTYTIEKGGINKIIHQSPLFVAGVYSGMIEISFEIPQPLPHYNRD